MVYHFFKNSKVSKYTIYITATIIIAALLTGCYVFYKKSAGTGPVTAVIKTVYANGSPFYNKALDQTVFSDGLQEELSQVRKIEVLDAARIKNSKYPTDKPLLIEGEIFAGLYEGYTSYTVKHVTVQGVHATATVDFLNKNYKESWSDDIILINQNGWKIDNVVYDTKRTHPSSSLRATLDSFIMSGENSLRDSVSHITNPASENCLQQKGKLTIQKMGDGSEYGLCYFEDGKACEEWALLRGDCPVGGVKTTGYDSIDQKFCVWRGGTTVAEPNSKCFFKDKKWCTTLGFYENRCPAR